MPCCGGGGPRRGIAAAVIVAQVDLGHTASREGRDGTDELQRTTTLNRDQGSASARCGNRSVPPVLEDTQAAKRSSR